MIQRITMGLPKTLIHSMAVSIVLAGIVSCGSDGGNGPSGLGVVRGAVRLPFDLTAEFQPVSEVTVRLSGGGFDSTVVSGEFGEFLFADVPNQRMTLSTEHDLCAEASEQVDVVLNDTVTQDLVLVSAQAGDCLTLPDSGAARLEIDELGNRIVALFDRSVPSLTVLDIATGEGKSTDLSDLTNVYDLALIGSDLAVINYKSAAGFGVRFVNLSSLAASGSDVIYHDGTGGGTPEPGRVETDNLGQTVFVTHVMRQLADAQGMVYAISVSSRELIDADLTPGDGQDAFDNDLVSGSLAWALNIAFDPVRAEILVANTRSQFVTAIDWSRWGTFDRSAGLSAPTTGVRIVDMDPGVTGFGVELWDFAGGWGVGTSQQTPALLYQSGGAAFTESQRETEIDLRTSDNLLTIVPSRQSWFVSVFDLSTLEDEAIEEWTLTGLSRVHRYASQFADFHSLSPRAFAVDGSRGLLYVAYEERAVLEIFELCEAGGCISPAP